MTLNMFLTRTTKPGYLTLVSWITGKLCAMRTQSFQRRNKGKKEKNWFIEGSLGNNNSHWNHTHAWRWQKLIRSMKVIGRWRIYRPGQHWNYIVVSVFKCYFIQSFSCTHSFRSQTWTVNSNHNNSNNNNEGMVGSAGRVSRKRNLIYTKKKSFFFLRKFSTFFIFYLIKWILYHEIVCVCLILSHFWCLRPFGIQGAIQSER